MDDYPIIRRVQEGDTDAFELLVRKYHRSLLAFIFNLVRDRHLTEDIGQEVFFEAYRFLPRFDPERGVPLVAWLYTSARNRCISELRKRGQSVPTPVEQFLRLRAEEETAEMSLIGREERQALKSSLEQLPEPFRSTILMSLDGVSVAEISRFQGVTMATVKTRLFRARRKMRVLLSEYFGGISYEQGV